MSHAEILNYFAAKAGEYDLSESQVYWRLSNRLLWRSLEERVLPHLPAQFSFLDAGGGTGHWSVRLLDRCPAAAGMILDLSADMLKVAAAKVTGGREGRLECRQGALEDGLAKLADGAFDLVVNFHNVLGFVSSPREAIREFGRLVKPRGYVVSLVPNLYHMLHFNITQGRLAEAERALARRRGRFVEDMPDIHVFTPHAMRELYREAGLETAHLCGFPSTIYPGYQETRLTGSSAGITDVLDGEDNFARVAALEERLLAETETAARGNNILIIGLKRG